jgi:hypothetical protein
MIATAVKTSPPTLHEYGVPKFNEILSDAVNGTPLKVRAGASYDWVVTTNPSAAIEYKAAKKGTPLETIPLTGTTPLDAQVTAPGPSGCSCGTQSGLIHVLVAK